MSPGILPPPARLMSNTRMDTPPHTELRLTNLEIKAIYAEDLMDSLNETIIRQQQQIDFLLRELGQLRLQQQDGAANAFRSLREELPPHY